MDETPETNPRDESDEDGVQEIPEEVQDLTLEEVLEQDYNVVPSEHTGGEDERRGPPPGTGWLFETHPGEGALSEEEMYQDQHAYEYNPKSAAATEVGDPDQRDEDTDKLHRINRGSHHSDGELAKRQAEWDKERITHAMCNQVGLNDYQRDEAIRIMLALNLNKFGSQKAIEKVALLVIRYVFQRDQMAYDWAEDSRITENEQYCSYVEDVGWDMDDVIRLSKTLKQQLRELNWRDKFTGTNPGRDKHIPESGPEDRPDEYWYSKTKEYWERVAETWEQQPDEFREAIPDQHRETVMALRDELSDEDVDDR